MHSSVRLAAVLGYFAHAHESAGRRRHHHYDDDDYYYYRYTTDNGWAWAWVVLLLLLLPCMLYLAFADTWWPREPAPAARSARHGMRGDQLLLVAQPSAPAHSMSSYNLEYPGQIMFQDADGDFNMLRACGSTIEWYVKSPRRGETAMRVAGTGIRNLTLDGTVLSSPETSVSAPLLAPIPHAAIERLRQMTANADGKWVVFNKM